MSRLTLLLTTGHCGVVGQTELRMAARRSTKGAVPFGHVASTALPRTGGYEEDGDAIKIDNGNIVPDQIFRPNTAPLGVGPAATIREDDTLCFSGVRTGKIKCGPVLQFIEWHPTVDPREPPGPIGLLGSAEMGGNFKVESTDSGGPVWDAQTKDIVGLVSGHRGNEHAVVAPLLPLPVMEASTLPPAFLRLLAEV